MALSVIRRDLVSKILQHLEGNKNALSVYFVQATGGTGKTVLARDLGHELGSPDGNEAYLNDERGVAYSGILDVYDLDTNTNPGVEFRLRLAFTKPRDAFVDYIQERDFYENDYKLGVAGSQLEEQRKKVVAAFAYGLKQICASYHPVIIFDTVERLDIAADPLQARHNLTDDTATLAGWICEQLTRLRRGTVILLGRPGLNPDSSFKQQLKQAINKANSEQESLRDTPIQFFEPSIDNFTEEENQRFFADRANKYPSIKDQILNLQNDLYKKYGGKPLFLDLAILSLAKLKIPGKDGLEKTLQNMLSEQDLAHVGQSLVTAYWTLLDNPDQKIVLDYLVAAKNGLSKTLLKFLNGNDVAAFDRLVKELDGLEELPFIKSRKISLSRTSEQTEGSTDIESEKVYFLHDEMYKLAEIQNGEQQLKDISRDIAKWCDLSENQSKDNLKAASLLYRLRDNPMRGYSYFLRESDAAIRGTKTSLDISLRDAMEIFMAGVNMPKEKPGITLHSEIDASIIKADAPYLQEHLEIDRVTLTIRRLMVRGKNSLAKKIGDQEFERVKGIYDTNPLEFGLDFSEYRLWHGQATMYAGDHKLALTMYEEATKLTKVYRSYYLQNQNNENNPIDLRRLSLVDGRALNNKGYVYWMFEGQYRRAIREFSHAVRFFNEAGLEEEKANTLDNTGRAYAALDNGQRAISNIHWGLDIREQQGIDFRVALSRISLAQALSVEEQFQPAEVELERAMNYVLKGKIKRGVGLASIARGLVLRKLAERDFERGGKGENIEKYILNAEESLRKSIELFEEVIEPIRTVQSYNELGGVNRAKYHFFATDSSKKSDRQRAFQDGQTYYLKAINLAKKYNYKIEALDAQQDLAVLYLRAGKHKDALEELSEVEKVIPQSHHIKAGVGLQVLSLDEQVDAFYKLLGLVELQRGTLIYLQHEQKNIRDDSEYKAIVQGTVRCFAFAITYFERFGGAHIADVYTFKRIQRRFRNTNRTLIKNILEEYLPDLIEEYVLDKKFVMERFESVFGSYS